MHSVLVQYMRYSPHSLYLRLEVASSFFVALTTISTCAYSSGHLLLHQWRLCLVSGSIAILVGALLMTACVQRRAASEMSALPPEGNPHHLTRHGRADREANPHLTRHGIADK